MWPFFTFYGGKWRAAPRYPSPIYNTIVEPFAGAAGYAVRYYERDIILIEKDPEIAALWRYLIAADRDGDKMNPALSNLRYATRAENEADKIAHGTRTIGSRSSLAKLTEDQVREIRRRASEPREEIAREFGCSKSNIGDIIRRRSWAHI